MTYNYPTGALVYGAQNPVVVQENNRKRLGAGSKAAIAGGVLGVGAGLTVGLLKNPYISGGETTDKFARTVYENFVDKADETVKKAYNQTKEILNKLDGIKTPEELKNLFNTNAEAAKEILGDAYADFLNNVDKDNLASNKDTIKNKIKAGNDTKIQDFKNKIKSLWNTKDKKFVEPTSDKTVYNAVMEAKKGFKAKVVAKYTAIGAAAIAVVGFVAQKIIATKNTQAQNVQK